MNDHDLGRIISGSNGPAALLGRRNFLKAAGAAGGVAAIAPLLAACGSSTKQTTSGQVGAGKTIGISLNVSNAYASYVAEGVYQALEGTGYAVRTVANNAESSTELANVQNLLAAGITGLVMLPVNADTASKTAQLCAQRKVAFGVAQWPVKTPQNDFTAAAWADWTEKGRLMGDYVKSHAKPGNVIVVQAILGQQYSELIDDGLNQSLAGTPYKIVVREQGFYDRTKATNVVQTGLQAYPGATAVVTYAASMGDGVAQYFKSINKTDVTHITSDCDEELLTWLKTPYCNATAFHSAAQSGLLVARALRTELEGGQPVYLAVLDQAIATSANVDSIVRKTPFEYPAFASRVSHI